MHENGNDERNVMLYFLAGVGVGALIGAAAGLLMAPKPGAETRQDLALKFDELKTRVTDWMKEKRDRAKSAVGSVAQTAAQAADEAGA